MTEDKDATIEPPTEKGNWKRIAEFWHCKTREALTQIEKLMQETAHLTRERDEARAGAERLAILLHEKHFKNTAPQWKPLPDTFGIVTQIDNMICGIEKQAERRGYQRGLEDAAKALVKNPRFDEGRRAILALKDKTDENDRNQSSAVDRKS